MPNGDNALRHLFTLGRVATVGGVRVGGTTPKDRYASSGRSNSDGDEDDANVNEILTTG